jgi:arylformamidase
MTLTPTSKKFQTARKSEIPDAFTGTRYIDISVPIEDRMIHWPGDPPVTIERINDMGKGDPNNVSKICLGSHTGTHVDAPRHFFKKGIKIGAMPPDQMIGICRVIKINDAKYITPDELVKQDIRRGERILFKTRNSSQSWYQHAFNENFVSISEQAADFLAQKVLRVIGIDYLSVGGFKDDGIYIHRKLLGAGIWLIEGLDLSKVSPGKYYLICQSLNLEPGDGAPARAMLKPV